MTKRSFSVVALQVFPCNNHGPIFHLMWNFSNQCTGVIGTSFMLGNILVYGDKRECPLPILEYPVSCGGRYTKSIEIAGSSERKLHRSSL